MINHDDIILLETVRCLTTELDELITACYDVNGELTTPSKKSIMRARSMLPSKCKNTLEKNKS